MKIGYVGLGRMGRNMVLNLLEHNHVVVGYNRSPEITKKLSKKKMIPSYSLTELVEKLPKKKIIWLMVPAGKPVDKTISKLIPHLTKGDIIIDGGNSYYKDSMHRYTALKKKGIHFLDCGTSGGMEGARQGACMMIGGDKKVFKSIEQIFRDMTVKKGYGYMGSSGAGHFVKMVHNGIEYGMMGAIAEGVQALENTKEKFGLSLSEAIKVYAHGSIIESRLVSWLAKAWEQDPSLKSIKGEVPRGETEGEMEKLEKHTNVNMPILTKARLMRVTTRKKPSLGGKTIAAMRNQFGGHAVQRRKR